jgi:small subunit ribosomal protein S9
MADQKKNFIFAKGKRKESVARLRLYKEVAGLTLGEEKIKKGDIIVNGKKVQDYFKGIVSNAHFLEPLKITNNLDKYAFTVVVAGGGQKGQLDALIHAMSRALSGIDEKNKAILKKAGFLTRDARVRERRKVGMGGKARRKKQSPKR